MPGSPETLRETSAALVSIILPTCNRARFLKSAIRSIREQQFTNWELIIVDDGSTDETPELIATLTADIHQPVRCIRQENQGAYGARNTGLDHATGEFIAFYDSDDEWLSHHLSSCVAALKDNPDLDWVYGACRLVDADSNRILAENSFYENGQPRPFLQLPREHRGELFVLKSERLLASVLDNAGLYSGLQNSLIRKSVLQPRRFAVDFYNEAEDQLAVARALAAGFRFGYFDQVHVNYRVHEGNSSASAKQLDTGKRIRLMEGMIRGYESLRSELNLSFSERCALRKRLSRLYFWQLGYATLWMTGHATQAIAAFRKGIANWPWDWRYWKTYAVCAAKSVFVRGAQSPE